MRWLGADCYLLDRAGRRVQVGAPQLGDEQMAAAEHVERQVAVAIVIDPMGGGQRSALAE